MINKHQLKVFNLTKYYKNKLILDKISLGIEQHQIVGLLGPNGAGKTTCFYSVLGLVKASSGQIKLDQHDISDLPIHKRAMLGLGYLPQENSIFRQITAENNIMAILETRKNLTNLERQARLENLLSEFDIQHIRHLKGIKLSGGERRRVEIARALATDPKFILLDEPFAGIDPKAILEIKNILRKLKQKLGILITDHNVRDTLEICDKVYVLDQGQIIAEGPPSQILQNSSVKHAYLGDAFTADLTN